MAEQKAFLQRAPSGLLVVVQTQTRLQAHLQGCLRLQAQIRPLLMEQELESVQKVLAPRIPAQKVLAPRVPAQKVLAPRIPA